MFIKASWPKFPVSGDKGVLPPPVAGSTPFIWEVYFLLSGRQEGQSVPLALTISNFNSKQSICHWGTFWGISPWALTFIFSLINFSCWKIGTRVELIKSESQMLQVIFPLRYFTWPINCTEMLKDSDAFSLLGCSFSVQTMNFSDSTFWSSN